ncbi:unnamed protein product [Rhodiola kirilowii]
MHPVRTLCAFFVFGANIICYIFTPILTLAIHSFLFDCLGYAYVKKMEESLRDEFLKDMMEKNAEIRW